MPRIRCLQVCFVVLCFLNGKLTRGEEIFRSIARLRVLVTVEHELIKGLQEYINTSRYLLRTGRAPFKYQRITGYNVNSLESRLKQIKKSRGDTDDIDGHVTHPTKAFRLLQRYVRLWVSIRNEIDPDIGKDILTIFERFQDVLPDETDVFGACRAITRLQSTYQISVRNMADGKLLEDVQTTETDYTVDECYSVGRQAYKDKNDYYCVLWMDEGLRRYREGYPIMPWEEVNETLLVEYKAYCYFSAGLYHKALRENAELLILDPENERAQKNKVILEKDSRASTLTSEAELLYPPSNGDQECFYSCCRGDDGNSKHELKCRYLDSHPLLRLKRIGVEILHENPRIVMFRGLLQGYESDMIKELALPHLTMSKTIGKDNVTEHIIPDRVSNTAWISEGDFNDKLLPRITKRLELATGLSAYGAEPYQVLNYGIGGHYKPHLDCPPNFKLQRVATMLIYLSDVEYGGGTVFVKHGVRAEPKKGDATFWFNLNKAGETDLSTTHAGCPVLLGEKWVVNKWFNYHEQFSTRKCGLSPDE